MNSQIELYPHNQIAYDKLCDMLSQSDRACVIQPTGTGKFVIIAKLVQDNPDKRFLLLEPLPCRLPRDRAAVRDAENRGERAWI